MRRHNTLPRHCSRNTYRQAIRNPTSPQLHSTALNGVGGCGRVFQPPTSYLFVFVFSPISRAVEASSPSQIRCWTRTNDSTMRLPVDPCHVPAQALCKKNLCSTHDNNQKWQMNLASRAVCVCTLLHFTSPPIPTLIVQFACVLLLLSWHVGNDKILCA